MKKKILVAAAVLLSAAVLLFAAKKPLYNLYRDIAYYFEAQTEARQTVRNFARENHISYGEYPYDLLDFFERNPEAEKFVLNYPFRQEPVRRLEGVSRSSVPLFLQWDPRWGYEKYGSSYLAVTGCGPTCLAMAGYYLTGDETMTPLNIADFAEKNGYYAKGYGSSWTLFSEGAKKLGLDVRELPLMEGKILDALAQEHPVVLAMGKGDFTTTGHYIVLTGAEEGGFRVNDPNSPARSARLWTYEALEGQIKNIWEISAG